MKRLVILFAVMLVAALAVPAAAGGFGGGGPFFGAIQLHIDDLNQKLVNEGFTPLDDRITLIGGGGSGGPSDWTVGGFGLSGTTKSANANQEATLSVSFGGFHAERIFGWDQFAFGTGMMLGGGEADLKLSKKLATTDLDAIISERSETMLSTEFLAVAPTVSLRIKLTDFIFLKAQGAYLASLGDWKFQDGVIPGVAEVKGPVASFAIVFGGSN